MSRKELEKRILEARYNLVSSKDKETIDILEELANKALEQEYILDGIRAEIEAIIDYNNHNVDDYDFCSGLIRARNIIDKYRKE